MYQSKYYTCEEIDERLLKGYYDDAVSKGYQGTFEQLQLELASVDLVDLNLLNGNAGYTLTEAVAKIDELSLVHPSISRFRYTDKTYNKLRTLTYDSTKSALRAKVTDISTYTLTLTEFNGDMMKTLLTDLSKIGFEGSMYITYSEFICGKVSIFGDSMGHVVNQEVLTNCTLSSDRTSLESSNNHTKIFKYDRFFNLSSSSTQDRDGNLVPSHDNSLWYTNTYELVPDAYVICDTASEIKDKTITVEGYYNIPAHGGGSIKVKFVHANTSENPTLDISGTGAKPLYLGKDPVSPTNTWADGSIVEVFYDGENYRILSDHFENIRILQYFYDQDCIEFVHVVTDQDGKLLWAIKADGTIYYGVGIPPQVQDAINKAVEDLQVDLTSQIEDLDRIINEHLDDIETRIPQDSDNKEFIQVILDEEGRIIEGIRPDGTKYIAQLESPTFDEVKKEISENIQPQLDELSKKIAENVFAIEVDDEGNLLAVIDEDSNVTNVGITDDGDIYADFNIE